MKQEKFLSKRLANPSRYNSSISSSSTSSSSTMSSLSSINTNRTHSLDHSYGMDNDDLTLEHTQAPTRNKVVSIHNHHINRNQNRRVCFASFPFQFPLVCLTWNLNYLFLLLLNKILTDLPNSSNTTTTLAYSTKSNSAITLDTHDKIVSFWTQSPPSDKWHLVIFGRQQAQLVSILLVNQELLNTHPHTYYHVAFVKPIVQVYFSPRPTNISLLLFHLLIYFKISIF